MPVFRFRAAALCAALALLAGCHDRAASDKNKTADAPGRLTLLRDITLIDGTGQPERRHVSLLLRDSLVAAVLPLDSVPAGAKVLKLTGQVVMPTLVNTHGHLGLLKGTSTKPENYTRANVTRQLRQYQQYGIGAVLSLGTDQDSVFAFRKDSRRGALPGAALFTAGYGIGVPGGAPEEKSGANKVFRPRTADEARQAVRQLKALHPDFVKIWVDDFGGKLPKMTPEVYRAVLDEAQKQQLRVAAHVYKLTDARDLVAHGVAVLAHSIRDQDVDAAFVQAMKSRNVAYIPTLTLDEFQFAYAGRPAWLDDPFFRQALEPGVLDSLRSTAYRDTVRQQLPKEATDYKIALRNLKALHDGGVLVALGTDSGADPTRAQGFAEHQEMVDMVRAGLTPMQVLVCATHNGAALLGLDRRHGTLAPGNVADFIVLEDNPLADIHNTQRIRAVWRAGRQVAGPVANAAAPRPGTVLGQVQRLDPRLDSLLSAGATLNAIAAGFDWVEGPLWLPSEKALLFSHAPTNRILRWTAATGAQPYLLPSGYTGQGQYSREPGSNGLTLNAKNELTLCAHGDRRVAVLTKGGGLRTLVDNYQGRRFNSPNDLVYRRATGDLYFTDPPYGLPKQDKDPARELPFAGVYRLAPDGQLTLLLRDLNAPNGVALSPDEKTLYVTNSDPKRAVLRAFPVLPDGNLGPARTVFDFTTLAAKLPGLPDGLKVDQRGNIFVSGPGGLHILAPDGTRLGFLAAAKGVTMANCAWGDADGGTLYVAAGRQVGRIRTRTRGANMPGF